MKKELPERKPLRLQGFDYNTPGVYFITICTYERKCTLSRIVGAIHESPVTQLTVYGEIAQTVINNLPQRCMVQVEQYVIMPNHIHLLLKIDDKETVRAIRESPLQGRSEISKAIGYIKMNVSKQIHDRFGYTAVWQRGFYDHVIRNSEDYLKISTYIEQNPLRWQYDKLYAED